MRTVANKVTCIVRRDWTFVDLIERVLNYAVEFEVEYNGKLMAIQILDFVKDMMCSDFLTRKSARLNTDISALIR